MSPAVLFFILLTVPVAQAASVKDVAWLSGCWELTRGNRHVTEQWTTADGGTMLGLSRTISDSRTTDYEFIIIRESGGRLEYVAKPSRQAEAVFTSVTISGDDVIFENPQHDFPTRIRYRRQTDGSLLATTEGVVNGNRRVIEFPYRAASCAR
jgi:hypothetical protein